MLSSENVTPLTPRAAAAARFHLVATGADAATPANGLAAIAAAVAAAVAAAAAAPAATAPTDARGGAAGESTARVPPAPAPSPLCSGAS